MERIIKAATVTASTDLGEFSAIAAAYTLDRDGDVIVPGAFAKTIGRWQASGKQVPLHWNHSGAAADIIGSIDPTSMSEIDGVGLKVSGRVDIEHSDTAKEAWRSMKNGAMSLSFGYMVVDGNKNKDGVNELRELDLFEISIVPAPANPDTRILSMKSAEAAVLERLQEAEARLELLEKALGDRKTDETDKELPARSVDPLRKRSDELAIEFESEGVDTRTPPAAIKAAPEPVDIDELKRTSREWMFEVLNNTME